MEDALRQPMVLVVEDEPLIRMMLVDALDEAGFAVVEAGDADEGLRAFSAQPEIEAIVTDVHMPGSMDGFALARHVQSMRPDLKALIVSGKFLPTSSELSHARRFLPKPYDVEKVIEELFDMIGLPPGLRPA